MSTESQISGQRGWSTERRIVFLGRTGSGKSATGNNILDKIIFPSKTCSSSVTRKCQRGTAVRFGRFIQIIDSPGLFDTEVTNANITKEVVKCFGMTAPGPHAFVLVVRIDRFTPEEQDTVKHLIRVFGEGMLNYLIVLFTRKDDLIHDGNTLEDYLRNVPKELKQLLADCKNRCIAFNNRGSQQERVKDVQDFLRLVDRILADNEDRCYTSDMYVVAEKSMKKVEEQLMRENEEKVQQEKDNIRREYEQQLKQSNKEHAGVAEQLQHRIQELEQERKKTETGGSGSKDISFDKELNDLGEPLTDMQKQKIQQSNKEHAGVVEELQHKIQKLELERQKPETAGAESEVTSLSQELEDLKKTLSDMKKQKEQEDLKMENERLRKEIPKPETGGAESEVTSLSQELKDLKKTLSDIKKQKEQEELKMENERLRKEKEALENFQRQQRENAIDDLNKEKPGVMEALVGALPTFVESVLPGFAGKAVVSVGSSFKKWWYS